MSHSMKSITTLGGFVIVGASAQVQLSFDIQGGNYSFGEQ